MDKQVYEINGKVALVTGAASGIGAAISKSLLDEGVKGIALCDFNEEEGMKLCSSLAKIYGSSKTRFIKCNVLHSHEIESAFEQTIECFGQLDIVLNNAGILNETETKLTIDINLTAVIIGTQLAVETYIPKYRSNNEGVVLNTASILGLTTTPFTPVYSASKHGVIGLGKSYGCPEQYNKTKVRVMSLCPGFTATPLLSAPIFRPEHKELKDEMVPRIPFQKVESVSTTAIHMIKFGKPGSVWIVNKNEMEEAEIVEAFNFESCYEDN